MKPVRDGTQLPEAEKNRKYNNTYKNNPRLIVSEPCLGKHKAVMYDNPTIIA